MPSHGREISYELRCCIVCLLLTSSPPANTFGRIGKVLGLKMHTVRAIFQRARQRAGSDDLREVLACVGSLEHTGRPPRNVDGTQESADLRALIMHLDDRQLKEVAQVWQQQTGQNLARSLVENVAHQHRDSIYNYDIVRGVRPLVPTLSIANFDDRDIFAQWAICRVKEGAIFIFTDECSVEVRGPPRSKPKISRPKGQIDTFARALPVQKVRFKMMIWAATCAEWKEQFPFFIWDKAFEDEDSKRANAYELAQENISRKEEVDKARNTAQNDSKSIEARTLREINGNIRRENVRRQQTGERGRLHQKSVSQIWPFDALIRDHKKNGIDWFLYRKQVGFRNNLLRSALIFSDSATSIVSLLFSSMRSQPRSTGLAD